MKNKAFTLIELLVVIVIIGILATISTATFSGYFAKTRDTERKAYVNTVKNIMIAAEIEEDSPDYGKYFLGSIIQELLQDQGYDLLAEKNNIPVFFTGSDIDGLNEYFLVVSCVEENLDKTPALTDDLSQYIHFASNTNVELTSDGIPSGSTISFAITPSDLEDMCSSENITSSAYVTNFAAGTSSILDTMTYAAKISQ